MKFALAAVLAASINGRELLLQQLLRALAHHHRRIRESVYIIGH